MAESSHSNDLGNDGKVEGPEAVSWTLLTILDKGITFEYVVPSFPIVRENLTEVKLQYEGDGGEPLVFDGFARDCAALDHPLPASLKIPNSYDHAFLIEVNIKIIMQTEFHTLLKS